MIGSSTLRRAGGDNGGCRLSVGLVGLSWVGWEPGVVIVAIHRTHKAPNSPPFLAREALVQQRQHFGDVELDVFEVEGFLVVLLHLEQIVEFEVELEQAAVPT